MVARLLALLAAVFGSSFLITTYALGMGCVPGTFVTPTGCQQCPNGTFSDNHNATKCSQCDICVGRHNQVTKSCTRTSNTQCACRSGYYFDTSSLYCLKCSQCKRGRGVLSNCTATGDTVCTPCEKGKTYNTHRSMDKCKTCTRCPKGHIVEQECTKRTDTVCVAEKDINNSKYPPRIPSKIPSATSATTATNQTTTTKKRRRKPTSKRPSNATTHNRTVTHVLAVEVIPTDEDKVLQFTLYALIALLVLLGVVLFLVCWRCKRRNRPRKVIKSGKPLEEPSTRTNSTDIIEAVENPYSSLPLIAVRQGGEKMLRDVPYTLISELSQYLNPGDRWKQLGGHLNFNSTQISNFAVDRCQSTQVMLHEWGQKEGATVVALQTAFRKMKWVKEERIVGDYV